MACAKLSERVFSSGRSIAAKSPANSRVTLEAPTKSPQSSVLVSSLKQLLDSSSCDVVVSDRPRCSKSVSDRASLKYVINPARYSGHCRYISQPFHLKNNNRLHALDQIPEFARCKEGIEGTSLASGSVGKSVIPLHSLGSHQSVFPAAVVVTNVCNKTDSKFSDSLNSRHSRLVKATSTHFSKSHPSRDEDDRSPSPAQLSFVLLKLRDEVIHNYFYHVHLNVLVVILWKSPLVIICSMVIKS